MPGTATPTQPNRGLLPIASLIAQGEDGKRRLKIMPTGKWVYHHCPVEGS